MITGSHLLLYCVGLVFKSYILTVRPDAWNESKSSISAPHYGDFT